MTIITLLKSKNNEQTYMYKKKIFTIILQKISPSFALATLETYFKKCRSRETWVTV